MRIRLDVERGEHGLWHITSPDLYGLRVTETSLRDALVELQPVLDMMWQSISESDASAHVPGEQITQKEQWARVFARQ